MTARKGILAEQLVTCFYVPTLSADDVVGSLSESVAGVPQDFSPSPNPERRDGENKSDPMTELVAVSRELVAAVNANTRAVAARSGDSSEPSCNTGPPSTGERMVKAAEIAHALRISEATVRRYVKQRTIPFVKATGKYLFPYRLIMDVWFFDRARALAIWANRGSGNDYMASIDTGPDSTANRDEKSEQLARLFPGSTHILSRLRANGQLPTMKVLR